MTNQDHTQSFEKHVRDLSKKLNLRDYFEVSTYRGMLSIFIEWLQIFVAAFFCEYFFHWSIYLVTIIFLGARYLALGLLMHEAVHGLISKNKIINEVVGEVLCAWPVVVSMKSYRYKHLKHHQHLNTEEDPDYVAKTDENWQFPMPLPRFLKIVAKQLLGLGVVETFKVMSGKSVAKDKPASSSAYTLSRLSFYILILCLFLYFENGTLLFKYWFIPFVTWTQLINRWRRIAEHSGIESQPLAFRTRTTKHNFLSRLLLSPRNISYHCEHHLFPGIPQYNLPKVHKQLLKNEMDKSKMHISNNYLNVFNECVKM